MVNIIGMEATILNNNSFLIVTYNMHGFDQGIIELKSLCNSNMYDIIFSQEHWLSFDSLSNFDYFKSDYQIYSSTAMDTVLRQGMMRGRPFGGVWLYVR